MDSYTRGLLDSEDPCVAYRAHRLLAADPADSPPQRRRREQVADSPNVRRLLSRRGPDGRIQLGNEYHAYRKFQGVHWTLAGLAELGYPPGDASLRPLADQVLTWLFTAAHLRPPSTQVIPGQEDRVRRCASQEGLAIWYLHELGMTDERVDLLAARLVDWQWPDGGWNCDKRPDARGSSVQETLLPLRGLARHLRERPGEAPLERAVDRAVGFFLERRLLWRRRDGAPIAPAWGRDPMRIQWPFRWFDVLSVLVVMTELALVGDDRCADGLDVLAGTRLPTGGFPAQERTARTVNVVASGGTFAEWGPFGAGRANPFVTIDATWVLTGAHRESSLL